jgi:hypothetical protein
MAQLTWHIAQPSAYSRVAWVSGSGLAGPDRDSSTWALTDPALDHVSTTEA